MSIGLRVPLNNVISYSDVVLQIAAKKLRLPYPSDAVLPLRGGLFHKINKTAVLASGVSKAPAPSEIAMNALRSFSRVLARSTAVKVSFFAKQSVAGFQPACVGRLSCENFVAVCSSYLIEILFCFLLYGDSIIMCRHFIPLRPLQSMFCEISMR